MHAVEQSEEEDDMLIGTLSMEDDRHISLMESAVTETEEVKWTEYLKINYKVVTFKLDTGVDCNAMSLKTFAGGRKQTQTEQEETWGFLWSEDSTTGQESSDL